jgi:DNA-binding response OmpR family regulator
MSHTILLVDADESTTAFLADQLAADGYRPAIARTLETVYEAAEALRVDVIVLGDLQDRRLTVALLQDIRAGARPFDPDVGVIVLSQHAGRLDVLRAFDHGADDVVAKPFSYPELRARIKVLLRHLRSPRAGEVLRVNDLEIDTRTRLVTLAGEAVGLTQKEFALLCHLAAEPQRVFTKQELCEEVWGFGDGVNSRTLDSHVCRLRNKLGVHGDRSWVLNVWGVGYALTPARPGDHGLAA